MMPLSFFTVPAALGFLGVSVALLNLRWLRWWFYFRDSEPMERSNALLQSWLTPEQEKQWSARGQFEVVGCDTGIRYRLTTASSMNIQQLDAAGRTVRKWCFVPAGDLARGDVLLAQKFALETMEREALAIANRQTVGFLGARRLPP
jgi:hypothetical protein